MKSESYARCSGCGEDCDYLDTYEDESCWGEVRAIDEAYDGVDMFWVHVCSGHYERGWCHDEYIPEEIAVSE